MAYTYPQSYGMGMDASYDPQEEERKRLERQLQELSGGAPEQPIAGPVSPEQIGQLPEPTQPNQPTQSMLPQPSEPVQVAGPMQAPPQPQTMDNNQLQQAMSMDTTAQPDILDQFANQGIKMPGMQMQVGAGTAPATNYVNQYQSIQDDPGKLLQFSQDETIPDWMKGRARNRAADILDSERQKQLAKERMQNMGPNDLEKALREKTTGGSWFKAIMYGMLGMENSAQEEAAKLGLGKETSIMGTDGKPYIVKLASNGTPIEGYNAETGAKLKPNELVSVTAGAAAQKGATTHTGKMQDMTTGEVYYERTTPQGIQLVDTNGKRYSGPSNNLRPFGIGSDIATKNQMQLQELQNKLAFAGPTASVAEREKIIAESEARFGPLPEEYKARVRGGTPQVQGTVPTGRGQTQMPDQAMPGAQPVAQGQPTVAGRQPTVQGQPTQAGPVAPRPMAQTAPAAGGAGQRVGGMGGATPAQREANLATQQKQAAENIQVAGARSQSFNKILDEEVRPQAQAGDTVSSVRKQQFAMFDRPGVDSNKIFGLYNAAQENPGDQKLSILRDIFGGTFKPETEVSQRIALLNLNPQEKSALMEYNIANQRINAATLKQTAGPGSVSDAEQRANRESNVDPTKIPALGAYNAMAQSQFSGDLARYKGDWAEKQPASNALQLDKAWRKEQSKLSQLYGEIAKKRATYISSNGATTAAVREGYKRYPIPEYDPQTESWKKTKPLAEIYGR